MKISSTQKSIQQIFMCVVTLKIKQMFLFLLRLLQIVFLFFFKEIKHFRYSQLSCSLYAPGKCYPEVNVFHSHICFCTFMTEEIIINNMCCCSYVFMFDTKSIFYISCYLFKLTFVFEIYSC